MNSVNWYITQLCSQISHSFGTPLNWTTIDMLSYIALWPKVTASLTIVLDEYALSTAKGRSFSHRKETVNQKFVWQDAPHKMLIFNGSMIVTGNWNNGLLLFNVSLLTYENCLRDTIVASLLSVTTALDSSCRVGVEIIQQRSNRCETKSYKCQQDALPQLQLWTMQVNGQGRMLLRIGASLVRCCINSCCSTCRL